MGVMIGFACILLLIYEVSFIPPSTVKFSADVFEDFFRKEVQKEPYSSIEQISVYRCQNAGWWSLERLEKSYGPPVTATNLSSIEQVIDELHFPGERPPLNTSGITDKFHVIAQTKTGEKGYARVLQCKAVWYVRGNNTAYEIDEPSFLISLMTEQPQPSDANSFE